MANCSICGRLLDQEGDERSLDCGGDCYSCIKDIEYTMQADKAARMIHELIELIMAKYK